MAAKDQFSSKDHAEIYRSYRRDTPNFLIEKVISYLKEKYYDGPLNIAVDVGCGSGQSTVNLAPYFKTVHAMDVSEAQIQQAKANRSATNITYETAAAEVIPFGDGSVQLVSVGCALHWFQLDVFFPEVRRVLCDNGILVVYVCYELKPLLECPEMNQEVDKVWEEFLALCANHVIPQWKIVMNKYKDVTFPFEEVTKSDNIPDIFDGKLEDVIGYMSSACGYVNFKRQSEQKAVDYLKHIEKRLRESITKSNLDADGPLKLYREYLLILCRKTKA